jgi:hypothetical protein
VKANVEVADSSIARAARDDFARFVLFEGGEALAGRLPSSFRTELARARSEMTQWLAFPGELGCVPHDLQLMGTVERPDGRFYVFQLRAGDGQGEGANVFYAGITGPWGGSGRPTTFSDFKRAAGASPEEHVRRILHGIGPAG